MASKSRDCEANRAKVDYEEVNGREIHRPRTVRLVELNLVSTDRMVKRILLIQKGRVGPRNNVHLSI